MAIIELMDSVLKRMEERGIKYPDSLYMDAKTIRTSLDSIGSQFLFKDNKGALEINGQKVVKDG